MSASYYNNTLNVISIESYSKIIMTELRIGVVSSIFIILVRKIYSVSWLGEFVEC